MLIRAVDDLIENCLMDNGLFYYKELPSLARLGNNTLLLESLAIAYELTGDKNTLRRDLKPLNEPFMKNRRLSTDKNVRKKMPLLVQVPVQRALHRVLYL